jgi:hypothetical protein
MALDGVIQAATDVATGATDVLNSQGSTDTASLASGHLVIVDIAKFTTANAFLTTTLAGPDGTDNQTISSALDDTISSLIQLTADTEQANIRRLMSNTTNNA